MQTLETINVGQEPNDGKGENHRSAFQKINKNSQTIAAGVAAVEQAVQDSIPLSQKGAAGGVASLGADGRLPPDQTPGVQTLPATAHDLNSYQTPGSYRQASTAGAQAGTNYPQATGGILVVEGTGTAGQTVQRYTVASTGPVSPTAGARQYWRMAINTSWSPWQEVHTAGNSLPYLGRVEAGADLNNYANRGMWAISASSVASGGTNFPIANSGWLLVFCEASFGAAAGTNVNQIYIGSNGNRQFFRSLVGGVWSAWEEFLRSSLLGAAGGLATLDGNVRLAHQHAFCEPLAAGTDANTAVFPGFYFLNSDAQATAALNWPVLLAGTLQVEAVGTGNLQITQTYTTRNGTGGVIRRFVRVRFGTSATWGTWQEVARQADSTTMAGQISTLTGQMAQTLGVGQTLQNVLASRASGVSYTNSTGRPIIAYVRADVTAASGNLAANVGGAFAGMSTYPTIGAAIGLTLLVPAGATYLCAASGATISSWVEYR